MFIKKLNINEILKRLITFINVQHSLIDRKYKAFMDFAKSLDESVRKKYF